MFLNKAFITAWQHRLLQHRLMSTGSGDFWTKTFSCMNVPLVTHLYVFVYYCDYGHSQYLLSDWQDWTGLGLGGGVWGVKVRMETWEKGGDTQVAWPLWNLKINVVSNDDIFFHGEKKNWEAPCSRSRSPWDFLGHQKGKLRLSPHTVSPVWLSAVDGLARAGKINGPAGWNWLEIGPWSPSQSTMGVNNDWS